MNLTTNRISKRFPQYRQQIANFDERNKAFEGLLARYNEVCNRLDSEKRTNSIATFLQLELDHRRVHLETEMLVMLNSDRRV